MTATPDPKVLSPDDWRLKVYGGGYGFNIADRRRPPTAAVQKRILATQGNDCLYCGIPIGTQIVRVVPANRRRTRVREGIVTLRRNWDHFVPYAYAERNPDDNWVIACHVCNGIKSSRMFDTLEEARELILPRRLNKGYEDARVVRMRLAMAVEIGEAGE